MTTGRALNERIKEWTARPGWYDHVTREKCNLVTQLRNVPWYEDWEPEYFTATLRMEPAIRDGESVGGGAAGAV